MTKLYGLILLASGASLLVGHLTERKKHRIQCLQEMIGFLSGVTYGITEWKQTLEKAILQEKHPGVFPALFQKKFSELNKALPLRDALCKALEELPLLTPVKEALSRYFTVVGKDTKKTTEEHYYHTKRQLEESLTLLQNELPKTKKLIAVSVYATCAMAAVLLL